MGLEGMLWYSKTSLDCDNFYSGHLNKSDPKSVVWMECPLSLQLSKMQRFPYSVQPSLSLLSPSFFHHPFVFFFSSLPPSLFPFLFISPPPPPPLHSPLSPLPVPQEYRHWVNLTFTARCRAVLLSAVVRLMSKEPASLLISRASRQSNLCLSGVRLTIACTAASPFWSRVFTSRWGCSWSSLVIFYSYSKEGK